MPPIRRGRRDRFCAVAMALVALALPSVSRAALVNHDVQLVELRASDAVRHDRAPSPMESGAPGTHG